MSAGWVQYRTIQTTDRQTELRRQIPERNVSRSGKKELPIGKRIILDIDCLVGGYITAVMTFISLSLGIVCRVSDVRTIRLVYIASVMKNATENYVSEYTDAMFGLRQFANRII